MMKRFFLFGLVGSAIVSGIETCIKFSEAFRKRQLAIDARQVFAQANDVWNMAQNDYQAKANTLQHLQTQNQDLDCATSKYVAFKDEINKYCAESYEKQYPEAHLSINFGIHFEAIANDKEQSKRSYTDQLCMQKIMATEKSCIKTIEQTTYHQNGIFIYGHGSKRLLDCGSHTNGLEIVVERRPETIGEWIKDDDLHEHRTIAYTSEAQIKLYIDNKDPAFTRTYKHPANNHNTYEDSQRILQLIAEQCAVLNEMLPELSHYQDAWQKVQTQIPIAEQALHNASEVVSPLAAKRSHAEQVMQEKNSDRDAAIAQFLLFNFLTFISLCVAKCVYDDLPRSGSNPQEPTPTSQRIAEIDLELTPIMPQYSSETTTLTFAFGDHDEHDASDLAVAQTIDTLNSDEVPLALVSKNENVSAARLNRHA